MFLSSCTNNCPRVFTSVTYECFCHRVQQQLSLGVYIKRDIWVFLSSCTKQLPLDVYIERDVWVFLSSCTQQLPLGIYRRDV